MKKKLNTNLIFLIILYKFIVFIIKLFYKTCIILDIF